MGGREPHLPIPLGTELELVTEAPCRTLWGSAADLVLSLLRAWSYSDLFRSYLMDRDGLSITSPAS